MNNKEEIKSHDFFSDIDWDLLAKSYIKPPINLVECKKELSADIPTTMKEGVKFTDIDYDQNNADYNRVKNFTFARMQSPKPTNYEIKQSPSPYFNK